MKIYWHNRSLCGAVIKDMPMCKQKVRSRKHICQTPNENRPSNWTVVGSLCSIHMNVSFQYRANWKHSIRFDYSFILIFFNRPASFLTIWFHSLMAVWALWCPASCAPRRQESTRFIFLSRICVWKCIVDKQWQFKMYVS